MTCKEVLRFFVENPFYLKLIFGVLGFFVLMTMLDGALHPNDQAGTLTKERAQYPAIPNRMLYKPDKMDRIFPLGHYGNRWFGIRLDEDFHLLLYGASGSGKSRMILLNFLLSHLRGTPMFVVDIKGELHQRGALIGEQGTCICSLTEYEYYGYDPFYRLSDTSSDEHIAEAMFDIACFIIPVPPHRDKDGFWIISARDLLQGLLIYYYRQGHHTLVDCIERIYQEPLAQTIETVQDTCSPTDPEYMLLSQYFGMKEDASVLHDTHTEMSTYTRTFLNREPLKYALDDNPRRISPMDLLSGKNIFLNIPEDQLQRLQDVMRLILNQVLSELEIRPLKDARKKKVMVIIDELGRISSSGRIYKLLDAAHTLRSRGCHLVLATQDRESLIGPYTESEVATLENNSWKLILSASTAKTVAEVKNWVGTYKERNQAWNDVSRSVSTSFQDKYIVDAQDLITLPDRNEAILISPHGYYRFTKTYFEDDPDIGPVAAKVKRRNEILLGHEIE